MTQFALLMDELIDNEEYVAMLRNAEVINNFVGGNQQLAALFNLGKGVAHVRDCKAIDEEKHFKLSIIHCSSLFTAG
ncbi:hypothetical protein SUGI_1174420 [Cryptomeria japonica]|nr:hypothetical protein SUGI_1174420 [Cryptomeria japonica]